MCTRCLPNPNPNPSPSPNPGSGPKPKPKPKPKPNPKPNPNPNPNQVPHFSLVDKWSNQFVGAFAMWMAQGKIKKKYGIEDERAAAWSQYALAVPEVGSRASSGRAWQLWQAQRAHGRDRFTGRPASASDAPASRLQSCRFPRL